MMSHTTIGDIWGFKFSEFGLEAQFRNEAKAEAAWFLAEQLLSELLVYGESEKYGQRLRAVGFGLRIDDPAAHCLAAERPDSGDCFLLTRVNNWQGNACRFVDESFHRIRVS